MLSAMGDFRLALSAADFLCEADANERYDIETLRRFRCYEQTAIISYARPFTQSKGGFPSLSLKMCDVTLSTNEKELHERVLKLRNKMVAHSDPEMMNFASSTFDMSEVVGKKHFALFSKHDEGLQFHQSTDQFRFIDLITKVQAGLYQRLHQSAQDLPNALEMKVHFQPD